MHQLKIRKQPNIISYSKNDIIFGFSISPWTQNEIETNTRIYATINIFSHTPIAIQLSPDNSGYAEVNISSIIDAHLQFEFPDISDMHADAIFVHKKQKCKYKISLRLGNDYTSLKLAIGDLEFSNWDSRYYTAIKGGLAKGESIRHFIKNNLQANHQPLSFETDEPIVYDKSSFMSVMCIQDDSVYPEYADGIKVAKIKIQRKLTRNDGAIFNSSYTSDIYVKYGDIISLPILKEPTKFYKNLVSVSLVTEDHEWLIAEQEYYFSNTQLDNALYYHNSLSGLSMLPLLDFQSASFVYTSTENRIISTSDFISKNILAPDVDYDNISERSTPTFITPLMSQSQLSDMRDVLLRSYVVLADRNKYYPYKVDTETFEILEVQGLYAISIKLKSAIENRNYTRSGHIDASTCEPPLDLHLSQKKGDSITVAWAFGPNVFEGELYLSAGAVEIGPYLLDKNVGEVTIMSPDLPIVSGKKEVDVKIRAKCNASYSEYLTAPTFQIHMFMPPFLSNLHAKTYKGAGIRNITFDNNSSLINSSILNQNAGVWNNVIEFVSGSPSINTKVGTAGGTFTKASGFTGVSLKYNPPSPEFTGIDTVEYYVYQNRLLPSPASTDRAIGKIYLNVATGEVVDTESPVIGTAVYVTIVPIPGTEFVKVFPSGVHSIEKWQYHELRFFKDPFKIQPLDPSTLGINVTISFDTDSDEVPIDVTIPATAAVTPIDARIIEKIPVPLGSGMLLHYYWYIKESPNYYIL